MHKGDCSDTIDLKKTQIYKPAKETFASTSEGSSYFKKNMSI